MNLPIVRLELEGMKESIVMAFSEYALKMDADVQSAVAAICTPENLTAMVTKYAKDAIDSAIRQEISNFYNYGLGREVIRKAVNETLAERGAHD